jgi:hypothetical protein
MDIKYILILLFLGICGAVTELLMIVFGNRPWTYADQKNKLIVGNIHINKYIPLWLPILWSLACGLSIEIYKNSYPLFDPLLVSTQKLLKI